MPTLNLQPDYLWMLQGILAQCAPDTEVWAYGSRVTGDAHEGSDLDLVVRDPSEPNRPQTNLSRLKETLRESDLPILVDVLDWARIPESFRCEIEQHHVVLTSLERVAVKG